MAVNVVPKTALVDEVVKIVVSRLRPFQKVTVEAHVEEDNKRFASYAHFVANQNGKVDLTQHPSLGGSYTSMFKITIENGIVYT